MAATVIIDAFVIVIIGGMGSFPGPSSVPCWWLSCRCLATTSSPTSRSAFMYLIMLTVLVVRPGGLLGKEA